ncbi:MAG: BMP family ABC transporter substrate-binding protein [Ilumatobacteraceae bacterium]
MKHTLTRTRKVRSVVGLALAAGLVVASCGSDDDSGDSSDDTATDSTTGDSTGGDSSGEGPTLIYLPPTPIGGNPFLELGLQGTEAAAEAHGGTSKVFESTDLNSRRANLEAAIEEAPDVIVMNTFDFTDLALEFSTSTPDQEFILIDSCPDAPPANLHCGVFREYEGAYLLGIMAGSLTESNQVGSVGALDIPFIHRYTDSFALGAASVNADVSDSQVFIGGDSPFTDPARAKEQALSLSAQGVDQMFAVGSGSNGGVFEAAAEEGFMAYGVDINECPTAPGQIVDNNMKLVDAVVEQLVDAVLAGTAESVVSFGLAEGATGVIALSDDLADSGCVIADHPEIIELVQEAHDQIVSGELEIPDPLMAG